MPLFFLLLMAHLYLTLRTGFIQRKVFLGIRLSLTRLPGSDGDISPFASLATSLASTLGTGNIIGVGTAIALGGPGAVFWCWLTGILGMATTYAESYIAIRYRVRSQDGRMLGGAMYALERGLRLKWMGVLFACLTVLTSFGIGCSVQVNAISAVAVSLFPEVDALPILVGLATGLVTCAVIFGGVTSIARVCERLVPFMALTYVGGCLLLLFLNRSFLLPALRLILVSAFTDSKALGGGFAGSGLLLAARYGISRGLFSNEAGMGSAPIIAAAARTPNPVRQALIASTATFWDTVVVCLITGLTLVSSILSGDPQSFARLPGGELTSAAFAQIPYVGRPLLLFGVITFAYATILGWSYYGERCLEYLFGKASLFPYRFLWILTLTFSPVLRLELIWSISDVLNGLMAVPNLLAVILLSGACARDTRYYLKHLDETDPRE